MADKNSSESRRKLLKSIAVGSGAIVAGKSLPESWSRPVVESVLLPAHAITSSPNNPDNPDNPDNPNDSCTDCGVQLLTEGIGGLPAWNSLLVIYNFDINSYKFENVGSYMFQVVNLSNTCIGSTLRLNFGDAGGDGPLIVSVAIGNTVQQTTYTGGGLTYDVPVPSGPTSPVIVDIRFGGPPPYDTETTILSPTLTVIC